MDVDKASCRIASSLWLSSVHRSRETRTASSSRYVCPAPRRTPLRLRFPRGSFRLLFVSFCFPLIAICISVFRKHTHAARFQRRETRRARHPRPLSHSPPDVHTVTVERRSNPRARPCQREHTRLTLSRCTATQGPKDPTHVGESNRVNSAATAGEILRFFLSLSLSAGWGTGDNKSQKLDSPLCPVAAAVGAADCMS